jgi:anthranilate synthase/aminodeoxychorismate synthase-like glutamine amidotransferase
MILMIDNYDSFTYNLVQELAEISGAAVEVIRNDAAPADQLLAKRPAAIVVSPGPGVPEDAGVSMELIRIAAAIPVLGVCLGLQALAVVHGARVIRAPEPVHGKTSSIHHDGSGVMDGLPNPFVATRYHSLIADRESLPEELRVTAWTEDGLVMGLAHRERPHHAVQFHPESYLSRHGMQLLANFLYLAGVEVKPEWQT